MSKRVERIALIATATASILVSVLDLLGVLDAIPWLAGRTSAITLLVVALIAGYLVSERFGKMELIERSIIESADRILASLRGVEANSLLTAEEAFEYMAERIAEAELRIDHAALAAPIPRRQPYSRRWEQAITKVLKGNRVTYRYVVLFKDAARWARVKRHLADLNIKKYYVRYYDLSTCVLPALSFIVIDNQEVIMHYPYEPGQIETFLSVKHPDVVRLFAAYYTNLWMHAQSLDSDALQQIGGQIDESLDSTTKHRD